MGVIRCQPIVSMRQHVCRATKCMWSVLYLQRAGRELRPVCRKSRPVVPMKFALGIEVVTTLVSNGGNSVPTHCFHETACVSGNEVYVVCIVFTAGRTRTAPSLPQEQARCTYEVRTWHRSCYHSRFEWG